MKTGLGLKTAPVSLFQRFVIATAGFSQRELFFGSGALQPPVSGHVVSPFSMPLERHVW